MAQVVRSTQTEQPTYRQWFFPLVAGFFALSFLAAPWPIGEKAHFLLHGLCAQRPSHSFTFGGQRLPFDARMTGIYAGFLTSAFVLIRGGRHRACQLPGWWVLGVLVAMVGAMAVDGFNSLLLDLGFPYLYIPSNTLRLATGAGVGIVLAVALCYLVAISVWRRQDATRAAVDGHNLRLLIAAQLPLALMLTHWSILFVPLTLMLMGSAVIVFALLAFVSVVMITKSDNSYVSVGDVQLHASIGLILGVGIMALLAAGRFLYERHFGPSPLV